MGPAPRRARDNLIKRHVSSPFASSGGKDFNAISTLHSPTRSMIFSFRDLPHILTALIPNTRLGARDEGIAITSLCFPIKKTQHFNSQATALPLPTLPYYKFHPIQFIGCNRSHHKLHFSNHRTVKARIAVSHQVSV